MSGSISITTGLFNGTAVSPQEGTDIQNALTNTEAAVTTAEAAVTTATTAAAGATTSATNAASSATAAATSATNASTSASAAAASATTAAGSASAAATSASTTTTQATAASSSASAAGASAAAASASASTASTAATNAASSATAAAASATTAAGLAAGLNLPSVTGAAGDYINVNSGATGYQLRTPAQVLSDISGVSTSSLTSTLASYVTSTSLTSTLSSYVLTTTLSSYVTSTALTSTLSSYVTNSSLSSTLGSYLTTSSASSTYATLAGVNNALTFQFTSNAYTVSSGNFAANGFLNCIVALTGNSTLTIPSGVYKRFTVRNPTAAYTITVTTGSGSTAVVPGNTTAELVSDGTNVYLSNAGALTTAAAANTYAPLSSPVLTSPTMNSINGTAISGNRNRLINGNFLINQRGYTSGTALSSGAYGFDRWRGGASGCTITFTGATPDTTITITAGTLQQVIEGPAHIEGGTYVLSWTGTAQGRINSGSYASSPVTVTGITAGSNVTVEFNTGTLGLVQFESGTQATTYERRLFSMEFQAAQRYYQNQNFFLGGYSVGSVQQVLAIPLQASMRVVPTVTGGTITYTNAGSGTYSASGAGAVQYACIVSATGGYYFYGNVTVSAEF